MLQPLVDVVRRFVEGDLSADAFEQRYRDLFADLPTEVDDDTFGVLEGLAFACDDHVADPALRDAGDLDADGLRSVAIGVLSFLAPGEPATASPDPVVARLLDDEGRFALEPLLRALDQPAGRHELTFNVWSVVVDHDSGQATLLHDFDPLEAVVALAELRVAVEERLRPGS